MTDAQQLALLWVLVAACLIVYACGIVVRAYRNERRP
jgi:NADH:ubiquinone oxidoreductase subunit K